MGLNKHDNYLYLRLILVKKENPQIAITFISLILKLKEEIKKQKTK